MKRNNLVLFVASFTSLFLELTLIRWISTEIRIFAYLTNMVLLACFLGIGLGCYLSERKVRLWLSLAMLGLLIFFIEAPLRVTMSGQNLHVFKNIPIFLASFKDTVIHYQRTIENLRVMQAIGITATLAIFFVILFALFPLGQIIGRQFNRHTDTITAYSLNVGASLLGVWAISSLSFVYFPPWVWLGTTVVLIIALMAIDRHLTKKGVAAAAAILLMVAVMATQTSNWQKHGLTLWSPYQKLTLQPIQPVPADINPYRTINPAGYTLDVNSVGFMNLYNLSEQFRRENPDYFEHSLHYAGMRRGFFHRFNFPFLFKPDTQKALILGAGAGNDAAGAIRAGIPEIHAVEIDPGIHMLGKKYHPEQPYDSPRVKIFIDDARSYLKKSDETYDLIFFGLLDAHAQASALNNIRMDHYVYTLQSFDEVKDRLEDDGVLVLAFWVQRIWVAERIQKMIKQVFGWQPVVVSFNPDKNGFGPVMMITAKDKNVIESILRRHRPDHVRFIMDNLLVYDEDTPVTTDDWPYLYLKKRQIPTLYLIMIGILVTLFFLTKSVLFKKDQAIDLHFFFLGAAFLLLEFQNINKTALLFGSTWLVNVFNISAILLLILSANWFARRFNIQRTEPYYAMLAVSLAVIFIVPLSAYNFLGYWQKCILASIVLNLPIFFAGVIFVVSFNRSENKDRVFGSNLIGAAAGGLLEAVSFLTGIRLLVLVTFALYALSYAFRKK